MKHFITYAIISATVLTAQAQITQGKIKFEETVNLQKKLGEQMEQFKDMIPKEKKSYRTVHFTPEASICLTEKSEPTEVKRESEDGVEMNFKFQRPEEIFFTDLKNNQMLEQREFMTRKFLVQSDINTADWKLTGQQKTIIGITCMEATKDKDDKHIVAWFAPSIPVSSGPLNLSGLPGMILEASIDDGTYTIVAIELEADKADVSLIVKPKEGKKVSKTEYDKIVEEKTEEMMKENGGVGGKGVMIRIERE